MVNQDTRYLSNAVVNGVTCYECVVQFGWGPEKGLFDLKAFPCDQHKDGHVLGLSTGTMYRAGQLEARP